jgi:hypothetical protein
MRRQDNFSWVALLVYWIVAYRTVWPSGAQCTLQVVDGIIDVRCCSSNHAEGYFDDLNGSLEFLLLTIHHYPRFSSFSSLSILSPSAKLNEGVLFLFILNIIV